MVSQVAPDVRGHHHGTALAALGGVDMAATMMGDATGDVQRGRIGAHVFAAQLRDLPESQPAPGTQQHQRPPVLTPTGSS